MVGRDLVALALSVVSLVYRLLAASSSSAVVSLLLASVPPVLTVALSVPL